jgi:hypothetical protein
MDKFPTCAYTHKEADSRLLQFRDALFSWLERMFAGTALAVVYFIAFLVLDVSWQRAAIVSGMVIAGFAFRFGMATIRRFAVITTVYTAAYILGVVPNLHELGVVIDRWLGVQA